MDLRRTLGLAALLALLGSCSGHNDEVDQSVGELVVCGSGPTVEGIDVSQWQSTVNWPMVRAAGKRFAIARILHWPTRDTQFDRNWREIRANGLIRGAYIYFDPRYEVAAQADIVVRAVGRLGQGDLPVTLDVEQPPPGLPSPTRYAAMVRDLADRIEAGTGRRPMIYTGRYYWPTYVQSTAFRDHPLWHAQYTTTQPCPYIADAWRSWAFWQYSSTGRVSGISGNVDLDRFNGTYAELQRLAGFPAPAVDAGATPDVPAARDVPAATDAPAVRDVPAAVDVSAPADLGAATDVPTIVDAGATDSGDQDAVAMDADVPSGDAAIVDGGEAPAPTPPADEGGCGCRVGHGSAPSPRAPSAFAMLLAGAMLRSRRRRCG